MALTQLQSKTLIAQFMDDASNSRWSDTGSPSNLELAAAKIYDQGWSELLDEAPWIRSTRQVITAATFTDPGFIDTAVGGDLTGRFYRVQKILRAGREITPEMIDAFVIDQANDDLIVGVSDHYWFIGDQLWLSPLDDSDESMDIRYSSLPADYAALPDGTAISWPEGHELAFVYRAAYELMGKGSVEETAELRSNAERSWKSVLRYVRRRYPGPRIMLASGDPLNWGSVG